MKIYVVTAIYEEIGAKGKMPLIQNQIFSKHDDARREVRRLVEENNLSLIHDRAWEKIGFSADSTLRATFQINLIAAARVTLEG